MFNIFIPLLVIFFPGSRWTWTPRPLDDDANVEPLRYRPPLPYINSTYFFVEQKSRFKIDFYFSRFCLTITLIVIISSIHSQNLDVVGANVVS